MKESRRPPRRLMAPSGQPARAKTRQAKGMAIFLCISVAQPALSGELSGMALRCWMMSAMGISCGLRSTPCACLSPPWMSTSTTLVLKDIWVKASGSCPLPLSTQPSSSCR